MNDRADFTQGSILKKVILVYVAGFGSLGLTGSLWCS